jgi:1-acyl-sn-glycerol-3-phosphate acyltransferase
VSILAQEQNRPDLLAAGARRLTRVERFQIGFIRKTLEPGWADTSIRWCQRRLGAIWIDHCTRKLRHIHGLERLPVLDPKKSYICVANHRSFFDMYVVTSELVRRGLLPHRILFPVRSNFFYDTPLGFFVNGVMSFFAMYPPIFREKKQAVLNVVGLSELAWLVRRGGLFVGLHPEGTRKKDDDPYTFLTPQRGIGRLIHEAKADVLPVFVNGLLNDLKKQVASNFDGTGTPILVVHGPPVDFEGLLDQPSSPRVHRAVAERAMHAIAALGEEERQLRAELYSHQSSS